MAYYEAERLYPQRHRRYSFTPISFNYASKDYISILALFLVEGFSQ